jgi:hypothetical protein
VSRRAGVEQIQVVFEVPMPYKGRLNRATGVRCPGCGTQEVVYNGNYFCAGFDTGECRWALPHDEPVLDPGTGRWYDEPPALWDLADALLTIGCAGGRRGSAW